MEYCCIFALPLLVTGIVLKKALKNYLRNFSQIVVRLRKGFIFAVPFEQRMAMKA